MLHGTLIGCVYQMFKTWNERDMREWFNEVIRFCFKAGK